MSVIPPTCLSVEEPFRAPTADTDTDIELKDQSCLPRSNAPEGPASQGEPWYYLGTPLRRSWGRTAGGTALPGSTPLQPEFGRWDK